MAQGDWPVMRRPHRGSTPRLSTAIRRHRTCQLDQQHRAKEDNVREQRITMVAIVDAYGSGERAMGWYYYLDSKLNVPFKARCRSARPISVLKVGEQVEVLGMAPEEECETE